MRDETQKSITAAEKQARVNDRVAIIHKELEAFPHSDGVASGVLHFLAACHMSVAAQDTSDASRHAAIDWASGTLGVCVARASDAGRKQTGRELIDIRTLLNEVATEAIALLGPHIHDEDEGGGDA